MDCSLVRDGIEAYALGALDDDERLALEQHVAECPDCRRLVTASAEVAHMLPQALAAVSPLRLPPRLKPRVLATLEDADAAGAARNGVARRVPFAPPPATRATRVRPPLWHRWPSRVSVRTAITLGTLVLLIGSLIWGVHLSLALDHERSLQDRVANLTNAQQALIFDVVGSTRTVQVVLRPQSRGSTAYGKLYTRPDLPDVVAMAGRLPDPPPGQEYLLWLTAQGRTQAVGVMEVRNGFGVVIYRAGHAGPVYEAAEVTLQPRGATSPAGPPVLRWQAPH